MRRGTADVVAATLGALLLASPSVAVPPGSVSATEALAICDQADTMPQAAREAALARGEAIARAALAADPSDARAHFALFCHLGRRMKHAGIGLSALFDLAPLKREIDTAQRLAPNDADVLAAKGALLLELPRLFGGDPIEAERLLHRALVIEPSNTDARCFLAAALRARGETPSDVPPDC